jgi:predicted CoA-binding protein
METETEMIRRMLRFKRIAIVGLSDDPLRPSYEIAEYLMMHGYQIIPVNPNCRTVLGLRCYPSLAVVKGQFDVVNVFRRSELCEQVTKDAIAAGAQGVWLQLGVWNAQAASLAKAAGIDFVQNRCIKIEHMS